METTRIDGHHSKQLTTDATAFYREYWKKGIASTQEKDERLTSILDCLFPQGIQFVQWKP